MTLKPVSLAASFDLGHNRASFLTDYDDGKMDGFDKNLPEKFHHRPFSYAPASQVQPYLDMATQYTFADNMFQTQQAGSYSAPIFGERHVVGASRNAVQRLPDKRSDDLGDCFDFKKSPRKFVPIQAPPFNPSSDTTSGPDIEDPE